MSTGWQPQEPALSEVEWVEDLGDGSFVSRKTSAKLRMGTPNAMYRIGDPLTLPPGDTKFSSVIGIRELMGAICRPVHHALPGIYSVEQFRAALERERARVDRNGHRIALALIQVGGGTSRAPRVIDVLKDRLRLTDEAGWFDRSRTGGGRMEPAPIRREVHRPGPVLTLTR